MVWPALIEQLGHVFSGVGDRLVRQRGLENSVLSMKSKVSPGKGQKRGFWFSLVFLSLGTMSRPRFSSMSTAPQ